MAARAEDVTVLEDERGTGIREAQAAPAGRVLLVEDESNLALLIRYHLQTEGLEVHEAADGGSALELARRLRPDLILLDVMLPVMDGFAVSAALREDPRTANVFVIMLSARARAEDRMLGLAAGADEYLTKPFRLEELAAVVQAALRRVREMRAASPLTGLPGNVQVRQRLERDIRERRPFALLYVDLDHFKAYNDRFGFVRGDQALQALAEVVRDAADECAGADAFVGHVGGDDFVAVVDPSVAETLAARIVIGFDRRMPTLYDPPDLARGSIVVVDRRGIPRRWPLLSVSIGVTSTANRAFEHVAEAVSAATELKAVAKRDPRSSFAVDRRRS